jgi:4-hydroxy-tetrahydrodipicolinate synthase
MEMKISNGVWPTMITPFTESNEIDYVALERIIEWYISNQVDGLFAVCQSSEMFFLSLAERVKLAKFVKEKAAGRVPVIASGHIPENIALSFYECPHPYKRIISPALLKWCSETGRFFFLKDTSCDLGNMNEKMKAVGESGLKIYNANTATLLESLKLGIAGYSGIMANFHPDLYVWLHRNWAEKPEEAEHLISFLSMTSLIEKQLYPVNAKYYLMLEGIMSNYHCRSKNHLEFTATNRLEIEQLHRISKAYSKLYQI